MTDSYFYSKHDGYSMHGGVRVDDGKMHPHREDERNIELAVKLGFTVDRAYQYQTGIEFHKGRIRIWQTLIGGQVGWQVADLYPPDDDPTCDYYQNHRPVGSLSFALLREAYRA